MAKNTGKHKNPPFFLALDEVNTELLAESCSGGRTWRRDDGMLV